MRALLQRVTGASVTVDDNVVGSIGSGLCVFVGVTHHDDEAAAARLAQRIWHLRIMSDDDGMMNLPVAATGGEILVVSQFTLYADTAKGRRPSYTSAARPEIAAPLVERVVAELTDLGATVAQGVFGADMAVRIDNDGPVTISLEV